MSYLVLARKYRPRTFAEVVGQKVVTDVLAGAIADSRLGHAYLFAGPRGTGKTTIARILAKCLNCEDGSTAEPCNACERCLGADQGTEVDIVELDAASHTGVDTIRDLRDEVAYAPMRARHKVYIVDEVHMLSKGAFNALLKTLEEPPPHVTFLFATTEPHKVLDTILSRCQVLKLRPLTEPEIAAHLDHVFELEGIRSAAGVTLELARGANGGMRDALSLADKLLALAGMEPTLEDVERLGEDGGARVVEELLGWIERSDRAALFAGLESFGGSETELAATLLERLRVGLLVHHCGADTPLVTGTEGERRAAGERIERLGPERTELWMQELLRARERMRLFPGEERLVLEVALLELCRSESTMPLGELERRLSELETALESELASPSSAGTPGAAPPATPGASATRPSAALADEELRPQPPPARPAPAPKPGASLDLNALWKPFLEGLEASQGALAGLLRRRGELGPDDGVSGGARLVVRPRDAAERKLLEGKRARGACERALSQAAGREIALRLEVSGAATASAEQHTEAGDAGKSQARKPARKKDDFTTEVADLFGGVIEDLP